MPVTTLFFITEPKIEVHETRQDFGLVSRTYDSGIIRQLGQINVHNPATQKLETVPHTVDIPLKLASNDVYF